MKKLMAILVILLFLLSGCSVSSSQYDALQEKYSDLEIAYDDLKGKLSDLRDKYSDLEEKYYSSQIDTPSTLEDDLVTLSMYFYPDDDPASFSEALAAYDRIDKFLCKEILKY